MEILLQNFVVSFFYSHICFVSLDFLFTENNLFPRLIKQESCRSSQIVYALNMRSIKILQRYVLKVLFTLLTKQQFYATY